MKLSRYNLFSMFKLFESLLEMDSELFQLLKYMETSSPIATSLVKIVTNRKDIKLSQNYLKPAESNDELKFLNDAQGKRAKENGEDPFEKKGNIAKIGRIVRQILIANGENVSDADIEKFVNLYKATWNKKYAKSDEKMRFVSGEDIRFWYNEKNYNKGGGTLNNSCMRYEITQDFLDIYALNPECCRLLIYVDDNNDLLARAIVWKLESPVNGSDIYLDRIYYTHDHMQRTMWEFATEKLGVDLNGRKYINSHWNGGSGTFKVKLQKAIFKKYPYMDSIYYLYPKDLIISNNSNLNGPFVKVRNTSGLPESMNGFVISYFAKDILRSGDCEFIEKRDDQSKIIYQDWVPKEHLVYCNGNQKYAFKEDAAFSELYKKTYLKTSLTNTEWGLVPNNCLNNTYMISNGRIELDKVVPGIILDNGDTPYVYANTSDGEVYLRKTDCVPPIVDGDYWTPKMNQLRSSSNFIDYHKVDLWKNITVDRIGSIRDIGSLPNGFELSGGNPTIRKLYKLQSSDYGSFQVLFTKLDVGIYPIGIIYNNKTYCDKSIVDYFGLNATEQKYMGRNKYFSILCKNMYYKEVQEVNKQLTNPEQLVRFFDSANDYLKSNYSDYNTAQVRYELGNIPNGIKGWLVDKITEAIHTKDRNGIDFESILKVPRVGEDIYRYYSNCGSSYTYRAAPEGTRRTDSKEWIKIMEKYKKAILLYLFNWISVNNRDCKNSFIDIMRYRYNEMGFSALEQEELRADAELLRYLCYTEVSGQLGTYLKSISDQFSKYRDVIYADFNSEGSNGRDGMAWVFNRVWENHQNFLKSKEVKSEEIEESEKPPLN